MKRIKRTLSLTGVLALGAAGLTAAPAGASSPETETFNEAEKTAAEEYWTEERMANAQPADVEVDEAEHRSLVDNAEEVARGTERLVQPTLSAPDPQESPHVGKVFFSTPEGDFVCSGNLVASENQSTVATAGHCLHDGGPGAEFADNYVFAPAYDEGESEYGLWAAEELVATEEWIAAGDMSYDVGFAVIEEQEGLTLEEAVGGASPIAFNQDSSQYYTAYGYPAAAPYDGETLETCSGYAQDSPVTPSTFGIPCSMTGGSSGGPWFMGSGPTGAQASVNSYKYVFNPLWMYGPYFGESAEAAYDLAAGY